MGAKRNNGSSAQIQIPVIDISEASAADTADQLVDAVARYGFIFVRGEGLGFTRQILDNAFALVRLKRFLDRQTILTMGIVAEILLVSQGRERRMCYPSQRKIPSAGIFPVMKPLSHVLLEYRLVVNAFRNLRSKTEGTWVFQPCKTSLTSL